MYSVVAFRWYTHCRLNFEQIHVLENFAHTILTVAIATLDPTNITFLTTNTQVP